jgi:hypothetical protein
MSCLNSKKPRQPQSMLLGQVSKNKIQQAHPRKKIAVNFFNFISTHLLILLNIQRNDDILCVICIDALRLGDSWIIFSNFLIFLFALNTCPCARSASWFHFQSSAVTERSSQYLFQCSGCMRCRGTNLTRSICENMSSYFVFSPA